MAATVVAASIRGGPSYPSISSSHRPIAFLPPPPLLVHHGPGPRPLRGPHPAVTHPYPRGPPWTRPTNANRPPISSSSSSSSPRFLSLPIHLLLLAAARRRNPLAGGGLAGVGRCLRRGRCCICLPVARGKSERPCGLALLEGRVRVVSLLVWVARLRLVNGEGLNCVASSCSIAFALCFAWILISPPI